jgi:hypothetical protein
MLIRSLRAALAALCFAHAVWAPAAFAQDVNQARTLFEQGVRAADGRRWEEAVGLFRQSRAIVDRPSTAYNLAVALEELHRSREALQTLDEYFAMAQPNESRYADATALRAQIEGRVARLELHVSPASASVQVDGRAEVGEGVQRDLVLDAGAHTIEVSADGYAPQSVQVTLAAGSLTQRDITLSPPSGEPEPQPEPEPAPQPASGGGGLGDVGAAGIGLLGAGVAAGIVSAVTGALSQPIYDELVAACGDADPCPATYTNASGETVDFRARESESYTLALASTITFAVALAAGVAGVVLLAIDLASPDSPSGAARLELLFEGNGLGARMRM